MQSRPLCSPADGAEVPQCVGRSTHTHLRGSQLLNALIGKDSELDHLLSRQELRAVTWSG